MYFLWIDPGIKKLWYALIDKNLDIKDSGILLSEKSDNKRDFSRLLKIYDFFSQIIKKEKINSVAIEKLFFTKYNQANAEFVYWVRGSLIMLFLKNKINIYEYTPKELKKAISWNWQANKILMKKVISRIFNLKEETKFDDAADALWLAYLIRQNFI